MSDAQSAKLSSEIAPNAEVGPMLGMSVACAA